MQGLARVLMGLSHPLAIVGQAQSVDQFSDWPQPPQIDRRWYAIVHADDETALTWRTRTVRNALEGVGLRCYDAGDAADLDSRDTAVNHRWRPGGVDCGLLQTASLVLRRWPREVAPGWLGQALAGDLPVEVGIHIQPQDPQRIARFLKRQQSWQSDATQDAANELGRSDAERVRLKLIARTDRPCRVAVSFTVKAPTRDLLRQRLETLKHECGLALADVREATFEHDRGLQATSLEGVCNLIGAWRTLDCTSVASTWPFQPATVLHPKGAPLGTTHHGGMLVQIDPFDDSLRSFGGLITGSVGSGKSYFLKLMLRRMVGVEKHLVEHSDPPEYDGVPDLHLLSVADLSEAEQATRLREYITNLWVTAREDPRPRLLVLDELWSVLKRAELRDLVEEVARRGRKYGLALWIATQQIEELLTDAKAVFDNAAIRVYLQQEDRDLEGLCKAAHLSDPARQLLRGAGRGQALIHVGRMLAFVQIQAGADEHTLVTTDPRDVWGRAAA